ncbi:MAG: LysR family transcriptional regulator [Solobacterium sp.]|nr:LysR family transcriptional regulator [Solobacterium sp.]
MTIRHIKIFLAVCAQDCNVTRAAESLHMSQPAVSLALKELEEYYGTVLFERSGRRLVLAEAGQRFLEYSRNIASLFDDMEEHMMKWDTEGPIRVGASITIGSLFLPDYVSAYSARYPKTPVRALIAPGELLEEKILNDELDFALVEGTVHETRLEVHTYMRDRLAMVARPSEKYIENRTIPIEQLRTMHFLLREKGSGTREVFDHAMEKTGFSIEPVWEAYSTTALINAVRKGIGVSVLPYRMAAQHIRKGQLIELIPEGLDLRRNFHVIYQKKRHLSEAARRFITLCINYEMDYPMSTLNDAEI